MNIEEIAAAHWADRAAARELADLVQDTLDAMPSEPATIGSTKLLGLLMPNANNRQAKAIFNLLSGARQAGFLAGYFDRGKKGPMGHPSVHWHARKECVYTDEERLANQRKILGE